MLRVCSPVGVVWYTPKGVTTEIMDSPPSFPPVTVALVDDYDVVVLGVARILERYPEQVRIVEINSDQEVHEPVDIVLYDAFAQAEVDSDDLKVILENPRVGRTVVYTWNFHPDLIRRAQSLGVHGYLSKALPGRELVAALGRVYAGEQVISAAPGRARSTPGSDWPGRQEGLSDREAEILALITQGKSNAEVAATTFLSPNTVKSYIRTIYRKIGVASRTQAVLWGVARGFLPDEHRMGQWSA